MERVHCKFEDVTQFNIEEVFVGHKFRQTVS